ncbi:MAG TPA: ThuA domain-containing protein [Pirellulales bacterium]|nr:ThuA domain-containing protein [Pirellulales bacterium]
MATHGKWALLIAVPALFLCMQGGQAEQPVSAIGNNAPAKKKILFIAGKPSHPYAQHEFNAGCTLLAQCLNDSELPVEASVVKNGWPSDPAVFDGVDAVVMYCDGGDKHMVMHHLDELDALAKKGVGIGAFHYGVEVPAGQAGNYFLDWMGGFFETNWSVNPVWMADFKQFPEHPVTRGVKPFAITDEWYFHMRFPDNSSRVTPILTAVPPASTMSRPDGPHEGNPPVRAEVAQGVPQTMAWVVERPDGGRGFGFTGGHYHWNWGNDNFRKLALNMICWSAKVDVPAGGVASKTPTVDELMANLDPKPVDSKFDKEHFQKMLDQWRDEDK